MLFRLLKHVIPAGLALGIAAPAGATVFSFTPIVLPSDAMGGDSGAIANDGTVVGTYFNGTGDVGFTWNSGTLTTLPQNPADPANSAAYAGINTAGTVVGSATSSGGAQYAFSLAGGTYTTLLAGAAANAFGINDAGTIVGEYLTGGATHGFALSGTTLTDIDIGAGGTHAYGISSNGLIAGFYQDNAFNQFGFTTDGTNVTTLSYPSAAFTIAHAVNDLGVVVGTYEDSNFALHGFIYDAGSFINYDAPGAVNRTYLTGINDSGLITGFFASDAGTDQPFVLTVSDVPEPASLALLAGGLLMLAFTRQLTRPAMRRI
jgi:probable HAF family extracellular repeat protein